MSFLKISLYALCDGGKSVNFNLITDATSSILHGNSISLQQEYSFPSVESAGNIALLTKKLPNSGYIVSTYSLRVKLRLHLLIWLFIDAKAALPLNGMVAFVLPAQLERLRRCGDW